MTLEDENAKQFKLKFQFNQKPSKSLHLLGINVVNRMYKPNDFSVF